MSEALLGGDLSGAQFLAKVIATQSVGHHRAGVPALSGYALAVLAQAARGAFQSLEEIAAARLTEFAQAWDRATTPLERRNALASMMNDGIVRSEHLPEDGLEPAFQANLDQVWQALAA
ncbi:hypothetical protein BJI69_13550 [Luteibacter rhizovicinus DSM 16549]|uniref:Uncharacterized protein n=1 Tax=Luteibacter rhizovicinus DSM 16549 TaxID=1440763 RepID=A0A1L3EV05_9GAMM|nr:hypothetical protein [Luteibacter rhizovicinus]APG04817.1 hypothetical protein BJI69_13550 [Luteibacter rhizovicinus DSM 16549]